MAIGIEKGYNDFMKTTRGLIVYTEYFRNAMETVRRSIAAADSLLEDAGDEAEAEKLRLGVIEAGKVTERALIDGLIQRLESYKSDLI